MTLQKKVWKLIDSSTIVDFAITVDHNKMKEYEG